MGSFFAALTTCTFLLALNSKKTPRIDKKESLNDEHHPSILMTILRATEHLSGKNGALKWSILVRKRWYNLQKT